MEEENSKSKMPIIIGIVVLIIIVIIIAVILKKDNKKELVDEIEIIDRCSPNTSGSEVFYSDKDYDYIFYGSKSSCVVAVVNGKEYQINKALEENLITIDDAKKSGLKFVKEEKKPNQDDDNDSSDESDTEEEKNDSNTDDNEVVEEPTEDNDEESNDDVTNEEEPSTDKDDQNNQSNQNDQKDQNNQNTSNKEDETNNNLKRIIVYDRCPTVSKSTETFYSDTKYDYQSNRFQTTCTYVTINDKEYLLKDALDKKLVTIKELEDIGVSFQKKLKDKIPLEPIKGIIIDDRCGITAQAIETFYSDNNCDYQFNSIKSGCIYAIVNGKEYTIKQALNNKIITIEEAEQAGLHFIKKSKNKLTY